MVSRKSVENQLNRIGCNFRFWGRGEIRELSKLLLEGETIAQCVNGRYEGGFAMLCATDCRVLLIDHKPLQFLTIEDIRYDMVTQFNFSYRLIDATIHVYTNSTQALEFSSWNKLRLHKLLRYAQQRVMEVRWHEEQLEQRQYQQQFSSGQVPAGQLAPGQAAQAVPSAFANLRPKLGQYTYSKLPHFAHQSYQHTHSRTSMRGVGY